MSFINNSQLCLSNRALWNDGIVRVAKRHFSGRLFELIPPKKECITDQFLFMLRGLLPFLAIVSVTYHLRAALFR